MPRFDNIGMFWEDIQTTKRGQRQEGPMPSIPETGWMAPTYFPNLASAVILSLDTETYDPELIEHGPGWARGVGHIVGISVGAMDSTGKIEKWYYPIRHETMPEHNIDPTAVLRWVQDTFNNEKKPVIGANIAYDIGWLRQEGVSIKGTLLDVQFAEALLTENSSVALEVLGQKYLNEGKESNLLYQWLSDWFGGEPNGRQRKHLYRAPPCLVGPYAESDADLPLRLIKVLYKHLSQEGLVDLFHMECRLMRLMIDMRFCGVHVDLDQAEQVREKLIERETGLQNKLKKMVGFDINVNASASIASAFDAIGLTYTRTEKGNPSFTKKILEAIKHPIGGLIREIRGCAKLRGTFIESYILESHVKGMLFGQFHLLRSDEGGTRSGRFSSSTPNLQNIPSRDEELAPLIRGLYKPDRGHVGWRKYDYSQIEYRMLINFAVGRAGLDIRKYFWENPDTDYHIYAQNLVKDVTGILIPRKPIKRINFGLIYGMGIEATAEAVMMSIKETRALVKTYFEGVPFAKPTMKAAMQEAQELGIITTVLSRKSRFDLWEPAKWGEKAIPLSYEKALLQYGSNIKRAETHKALNRRLQGSAADLMKMAMLKCYEDGVFAETGIPRLTVHDELDFSDPGGNDKAFAEMAYIMETAIKLDVPVKVDGEIGPDWGHVKALSKLTNEEKRKYNVN